MGKQTKKSTKHLTKRVLTCETEAVVSVKSPVLSQTELLCCSQCNCDLSILKIAPLPPLHPLCTQDGTLSVPLTSEVKLWHDIQTRIEF